MKAFLTLGMAILTMVCYSQDSIPRRATGLLPSTPEQQLKIPYSLGSVNISRMTFPDSVDLSNELPPIGDQGTEQGSCVGWATAYSFKTQQEKIKRNWALTKADGSPNYDRIFSPAFIFSYYKQFMNRTGECYRGMHFEDAFAIMQTRGVPTFSRFIYNPSRTGCLIPNPNTAAVLQNASLYKYSNYEGLPLTIEQFKFYLSQHIPVMVGISLDKSFDEDGKRIGSITGGKFIWKPGPFAPSTGRHAVVCVGYNDIKRELKLMNSWGTGWGSKGYFYVPYDVFFEQSISRPVLTEAFIAYEGSIPQAQVLAAGQINQFGLISLTGKNFSNWIKKGYYVDYNGLRMGLAYLSKSKEKAVISFSDPKVSNKVIQSLIFEIGDKKLIFFKNYKVTITLDDIKEAGKDRIIKPNAAFYTITFEEISDAPIIQQIN